MTRKDYIRIVTGFRWAVVMYKPHSDERLAVFDAARQVSECLKEADPNFNRDQFMDAVIGLAPIQPWKRKVA